jgi:hypothetical protein
MSGPGFGEDLGSVRGKHIIQTPCSARNAGSGRNGTRFREVAAGGEDVVCVIGYWGAEEIASEGVKTTLS